MPLWLARMDTSITNTKTGGIGWRVMYASDATISTLGCGGGRQGTSASQSPDHTHLAKFRAIERVDALTLRLPTALSPRPAAARQRTFSGEWYPAGVSLAMPHKLHRHLAPLS